MVSLTRSVLDQHILTIHTVPVDIRRFTSQGVREDTAELASLALSDIASNHSEPTSARHQISSVSHQTSDPYLSSHSEQESLPHRDSTESPRPLAIEEVSEPSSSHSSRLSQQSRCQSALTELIKNSSPTGESGNITEDEEMVGTLGIYPVTVRGGIISQPGERTPFLAKQTAYGAIKDLESQRTSEQIQGNRMALAIQQTRDGFFGIVRVVTTPKSWNKGDIWEYGIRQPASLVPPVILGLLLNVLDALSYGQIKPMIY